MPPRLHGTHSGLRLTESQKPGLPQCLTVPVPLRLGAAQTRSRPRRRADP